MIKQYIHDNVLIVTPNSYKEQILLKQKKMCNIKFMTLKQFIENITFSFDEKSIYYLMKKYHYHYDVAKMYLNHLIYIEDINHPKIKKLQQIKKELENEKLLYKNEYILDYLKEVEIVVYGYTLNKFQQKIIDQINKITKITILEEKIDKNRSLEAYEFQTMEDEVSYVAIQIIKLLQQNIPLKNIKIVNIDETYYNTIKRIFQLYHLDIFIPDSTIYSNTNVQHFLKILKETKSMHQAISVLDKNFEEYETLINICNRYAFTTIDQWIIKCLEEDIKKEYIKKKNEPISLSSLEDYFTEEDYVFLINFNQNNIPKIYKNEDYLSDSIRKILGIDTSVTLNHLEKKKTIQKISSISHITITYKLKTPYQNYYPSNLISEMNISVNKIENFEKYEYSNLYNKIQLTKKLDQFIKFNEKSSDLSILFYNIKDFPYYTYQNKFTGISMQDFEEYINHKITLSYSSIDNYYRCGFRYYVNDILKLNLYEDTFAIVIGNLFHYILSIAFTNHFDFEYEFYHYLENREFTFKEKFFVEKLKKELQFIIKTIADQNRLCNYEQELYEEKVYINETGNVSITFMGIIDKIKYHQTSDKCYVAIIDYKTGVPKTNLKNTIYGIEMQLPIYLYLVHNMKKIKNVEVTGIFLQKILNKTISKSINKNYDEQRKNQLKLEGYSINDEELLKQLDITYKDSSMIKNLKLGKNGFYAYSKLLSKKQIKSLNTLVSKKIDEAKQDILKRKFDINPKRIGKDLKGCEYCKYQELCYKKEEDIVNLEEYTDLSFLDESK